MTNPPDLQVTAGGAVALQPVAVTRKTPRRLFWDRFRQDKAALVGGIVIVILIFIAIFGGPIAEHITGHPQNTTYNNMTDAYGVPLGPNRQFWFGADAAGRDLFVRTMYGARTSLFVGIVASGFAVLIGLIVGLTAGLRRRLGRLGALAVRGRAARRSADPDRGRHRRRLLDEQERLPRRPDPTGPDGRDRGDHPVLLVLHRAHRPRLHAVAAREGVRRVGARRRCEQLPDRQIRDPPEPDRTADRLHDAC